MSFFRERKESDISKLYRDVIQMLFLLLDAKDAVKFSVTCRFLYFATERVNLWMSTKLWNDPDTREREIQNATKKVTVQDYRNLRDRYFRTISHTRIIQNAWEFYCLRNDLNLIQFVIDTKQLSAETKNVYGETLLHVSALSQFPEGMRKAEALGCDPSLRNRFGETVLHCAAESGCVRAIKEAIMMGVDPRIETFRNTTILDLAVRSGSIPAVVYLLLLNDEFRLGLHPRRIMMTTKREAQPISVFAQHLDNKSEMLALLKSPIDEIKKKYGDKIKISEAERKSMEVIKNRSSRCLVM